MIKQFIKILLRNRTKNLLLFIQFSLSFIALYMLSMKTVSIYNSFTTELGFDQKNLVGGSISQIYGIGNEEEFNKVYPYMKQAMEEVRALPYVTHAGYLQIFPYGNSNMNSNGNKINYLTPEALKAIGLEHLTGETLQKSHQFEPNPSMAIVNESTSQRYSERYELPDVLGENLFKVWLSVNDTTEVTRECKIVGTFKDFRIHGRFRSRDNAGVVLYLNPFDNEDYFRGKSADGQPRWWEIARSSSFVIRTDGSVPVTSVMKAANDIYKKYLPENTTSVYSVEQLHNDSSEGPVKTFLVLFFICSVLTFVIVIGVIAITKENISKRFKEIGIRMALGSTDKQVQIAFFSELILISTTASILSGLAIFLLNEYQIASFTIGFGEYIIAYLMLSTVVISCVYSPIKKASSMKPNLALHYE